jgi:polysaccharide pyruvyl transferase WcaK-like protein
MSLLREADVVVGLRLHSLILAASMGTPAVSVAYDEKVGGFMELSGARELLVEPCNLGATAVKAAGDKDELGERLMASCNEQRRRILREADNLFEELN